MLFTLNELITMPAKNATNPMLSPIHGIYKKPPELYKKPTKSPKKHATNPYTGPITIPVSAEKKMVNENCVSANLNSKNMLHTTHSAVNNATYAIFCVLEQFSSTSDAKSFLIFDIKKSPKKSLERPIKLTEPVH